MDFLSRLNAVRVLVAEGSPDEMDHTTTILEGAGYSVHKAYYATDAVFALNNNQFDLALVDAQMVDPEQRALTEQMYRYAPMRWIALVDTVRTGGSPPSVIGSHHRPGAPHAGSHRDRGW